MVTLLPTFTPTALTGPSTSEPTFTAIVLSASFAFSDIRTVSLVPTLTATTIQYHPLGFPSSQVGSPPTLTAAWMRVRAGPSVTELSSRTVPLLPILMEALIFRTSPNSSGASMPQALLHLPIAFFSLSVGSSISTVPPLTVSSPTTSGSVLSFTVCLEGRGSRFYRLILTLK